jgi:hypothetical protein
VEPDTFGQDFDLPPICGRFARSFRIFLRTKTRREKRTFPVCKSFVYGSEHVEFAALVGFAMPRIGKDILDGQSDVGLDRQAHSAS